MISPAQKKRRTIEWGILCLLLALYLFLKIQGWWYVHRAHNLTRQLEKIRPTLGRIVLFHELEQTRHATTKAFEQIRAMDFHGTDFLQLLSRTIPISVTLQAVDVHPVLGLRLQGTLIPGVRTPEETLLPWAESLQENGFSVKVQELVPERKMPGVWRFLLKLESL